MSRERKSPINKERVVAVLKEKGISQRELCARPCKDGIICNYSYFNRCLKCGMIGSTTLNNIAKELDIAPDYLSGEYTPDIDPYKYKNSKYIFNDLISYSNQFNRDALKSTNDIIRQVTLLCGMNEDFYDSLSDNEKTELKKRVFNAIHDFHFELSVSNE